MITKRVGNSSSISPECTPGREVAGGPSTRGGGGLWVTALGLEGDLPGLGARSSCGARTGALGSSDQAALSSPDALRRTRLCQYGGPRAGARAGTDVGSPRVRRNRAMLLSSTTSATRRIRPWQRSQRKTSTSKVRFNS